MIQHLFKVGKRDLFINIKTFYLMKDTVCTCRNCLITEHSTGSYDTNWRFLLLHCSYLNT